MSNQEGSPPIISAELVAHLARYAALPLPPDRAAQLAARLAGPLVALRSLRPDGYDDLQPASIYRVPREG
jgi:hypothetical protein